MIKKSIIIINLLLISTLSISSSPQMNDTFKPIPKAFIGKWAGLHSTDKLLSKSVLNDLCKNGGDADTSYFVEFNQEDSSIMTLVWWTNLSFKYPVFYDNYTENHISGQAANSKLETEKNKEAKADSTSHFEYKIVNNQLYTGSDDEIIRLMRCEQEV